jgi:hypothetical protein
MSIPEKLVTMILRGHADKFKAILQEELQHRASIIMEEIYRIETGKLLESVEKVVPTAVVSTPKPTPVSVKFLPESAYKLKDGNIGILSPTEREMVGKLHESLNNDNKERMVKLLSESQESFNRILKLAKSQNKK